MDVWLPSLIAVAGTLLGTAVAYLFQSLGAARAERRDRAERRRQERLTACTEFVAAVTALRQGVISVWFRTREGERPERPRLTREEADRLGAAADHAKFRVLLLTDDPRLAELTEAVLAPVSAISDAPDLAAVRAGERRSQEALTAFIAAVRLELGA